MNLGGMVHIPSPGDRGKTFTGSTKIKKTPAKKNTEGFGPYLDLLKNWKIEVLGQMRGLTQL